MSTKKDYLTHTIALTNGRTAHAAFMPDPDGNYHWSLDCGLNDIPVTEEDCDRAIVILKEAYPQAQADY